MIVFYQLFLEKWYLRFSYVSTKHMLWYSSEASQRGALNEYPQHVFMEKEEKQKYPYMFLLKKKHFLLGSDSNQI